MKGSDTDLFQPAFDVIGLVSIVLSLLHLWLGMLIMWECVII
jgi:hypothetical protein